MVRPYKEAFRFSERAPQEQKLRPFNSVSIFVCEQLPSELDLILTGSKPVEWLMQRSESVMAKEQLRLEQLVKENSQDTLLARLDALFLEMAIIHSGGQSGALLSNGVERLSVVTDRPACFTYEDLIFINPSTDLRLFTTQSVGESEKAFYEGHKYIEDKLLFIITNLQQAVSLLRQDAFDEAQVEVLLAPLPAELLLAREHMKQFHRNLKKEDFLAFAKFHDKNPQRPESKSAGGQFSASIPTIDLLLAGEVIPEAVTNHWFANYRYFPVAHREAMREAFEQSKAGNSLKALLELKAPTSPLHVAHNDIDQQLRAFRATHYGAVQDKLPELLEKDGDEQSKLANFLSQRIGINHRVSTPPDNG